MKQGIAWLAMFACGLASAQQVHKCVGRDGVASYQNSPCAASQRHVKSWDVPAEPQPTLAAAGETHRPRVADPRPRSHQPRTKRARGGAQAHLIAIDGGGARCDAAKRQRERAIAHAGLRRDFDLLSRLDERVREACR